jgi:protein-S-isoprenylcysteine O-methyltransferase Ste14
LMRLPLAGWFGYAALLQGRQLSDVLQTRGIAIDLASLTDLTVRVSGIGFLASVVAMALLRARAVGKATGLRPRLVGLAGCFATTAFLFFPRADLSVAMGLVSTGLIALGNALACFVLLRLGRSFSIMPEARRLVVEGPYALVRHPLYLAEEIAVLGLFIQFASVWTAIVLIIHVLLQFERMRYEETVLSAAFPDYREYAARTARLIPALY